MREFRYPSSFLILALILFFIFNLPGILREVFPLHFSELIVSCAERFQVDPALIAAVIQVESGFSAEAVSQKGAVGLMQLMPETGAWLAKQRGQDFEEHHLLRPDINIELGSYYLKDLIQRFPTEHLALAAYNGGPANAQRWLSQGVWDGSWEWSGKIPFAETRNYVRKVGMLRRLYRLLYQQELS